MKKKLFQEPQTGKLATQDMQIALPNSLVGICQIETLKTSFAQPANCTHIPTLEHRRITKPPASILRCSSSTANNLAEAILSFPDKNDICSKHINIKKYIFKAWSYVKFMPYQWQYDISIIGWLFPPAIT